MAQRLGQQELIEPSPTRRLIVPEGCPALWGVDPSTRGVSIGWVNGSGRGVQTIPFAAFEKDRRLVEILQGTRALALGVAHVAEPGLIVVEQPSGRTPNLQLVYAVGVIMAALCEACHRARLETVPSATWKRVACGRGDIKKPKVSAKVPYAVLTWARANGYTGSSWDEADAWGIVEYARREIALEER